ncbi:MAG: sensor histidine kinase KdpD, partial [Gemmatimonadetes bacterium]|nr:sensor histidine kinase KdpD [Gemmatimonadota bacterium]
MHEDRRPDPDALLARIRCEGEPSRGRLKVFFGANAGVGKTYAMLEHAQARRREGVDVVVGVLETHGRHETERLLEGLEVLPRKTMEYRGVTLREFDLDAALARRPTLVLVDELAHTNAPGSRHPKRWQDVEELLAAGIHVYTTVNVQHLESLNDVVARITHVRVRETVPDAVLERADEIELVDLPPEELLKRLAAGRVYIEPQAKRAAQNFFRPGNLIALRQLALLHTAQRVDAQMQVYRRAQGVAETWPVAERILVGVGPAPSSARLVRATKRLADRMRAEWIAVYVETPAAARWPEADRQRAWETLRLAERLGAKAASITGTDTAEELVAYARAHNVTQLVVGKPAGRGIRELVFGSVMDAIVRASGDMDVQVITGDPDEEERTRPVAHGPSGGWKPGAHAWALGAVAAATLLALPLRPYLAPGNVIQFYLLATVVVALRLGMGPSILATVAGVAAFDFFCVPPYLTFAVADAEYVIAFGAMLVVGVVVSTLAGRAREQERLAREREARTAALLAMSRDLVHTMDRDQALRAGARHVSEVFDADVAVHLPGEGGRLEPWQGSAGSPAPTATELSVAQWCFEQGRPAGAGTDTLPAAGLLYLPLVGARSREGVLGLCARGERPFSDPRQLHLLETFANEMGASLERARLADEALRAEHLEEMDRLKSEFIAAASHALRSPLRLVADRLEALRAGREARPGVQRRQLDEAARELDRLGALVDDLLELSRLEAGRQPLDLGPVEPGRLVRDAVEAAAPAAEERDVRLSADLAGDLPPVEADAARLRTVLDHLLSYALHVTSPGGHVVVSADAVGRFVQFSVADDSVGISLEEQGQLFERFLRFSHPDGSESTGMG